MKYSDEFIEETLKENINLRLEFFKLKESAEKWEDRYYKYRREISKEVQNKNKEQIVRERDILKDRINSAIEYIETENSIGNEIEYTTRLLDILRGKDNE